MNKMLSILFGKVRRVGDKLGYINKAGEVVITPQFDDGWIF